MKSISHVLEYFCLRALVSLVNAVPRPVALALGGLIGSSLYHLGIYRKVVEINFDHTALFPETEKRRYIRSLYTNIGRYGSDFMRIGSPPPQYTVENLEAVTSAISKGKGLIAVLAHFGNWEILSAMFGSKFSDLNVLARPMHNPFVDRWLLAARKKTAVTPIYAEGALRKILTVLKRNGIIAMLVDQYSAEQGTPTPFLGKTANTVRTAAGLLTKTDCAAVMPYAIMQKDGSYRVVIESAPIIHATGKNPDEVIAATQKAHNDVISRWIIAYPDHYFGWFHRRFKDCISY
jgi:KDO2-lipid IV(A) lauroyltransferase